MPISCHFMPFRQCRSRAQDLQAFGRLRRGSQIKDLTRNHHSLHQDIEIFLEFSSIFVDFHRFFSFFIDFPTGFVDNSAPAHPSGLGTDPAALLQPRAVARPAPRCCHRLQDAQIDHLVLGEHLFFTGVHAISTLRSWFHGRFQGDSMRSHGDFHGFCAVFNGEVMVFPCIPMVLRP